jgi:hypothetical protein
MAMQENYKDDWLDRAFRLAFFLHGDREIAKKIAAGAMNKLETASNAQFKRLYYTPTGRAENSKVTRNRVSLGDLQLLQRLVFVESEGYEREKEVNGKVSEHDLLRFFIKHLVRISLKRNSFYVTLAVSRILHSYPTADTMEIYNIVVQDPERVHDDYYYRSRKGVLMKELKARFGDLLMIVKVNRGEERFDHKPKADDLSSTAEACLRSFTPWNSLCSLPEDFDPFTDLIKPFHFDKTDPDEEHRTEVNRIHATLHPDCFDRLTRALSLSSPRDTMEIPKFMIADNQQNFDRNNWNDPPSLDADELRQIKDGLSAQAESRKAVNAGFLRVVVDNVPLGNVYPGERDNVQFDLGGDAEVIEIYGNVETLLATHLLHFDALRNGEQKYTVELEGKRKIKLHFVPFLDEFGEVAEINASVSYVETASSLGSAIHRAIAAAGNSFNRPMLKPALTFGLVLLALTVGWLVFRSLDDRKPDSAGSPQNRNSEVNTFQPPQQPEQKEHLANAGIPKNENDRRSPDKDGLANSRDAKREIRTPISPKKPVLIEAPQNELHANDNIRKKETDDNGVLRLPMRESNQNNQRSPDFRQNQRESSTEVRSHRKKLSGKPFGDIKLIYFEMTGDEILGKQIATQLAEELGKSPRFMVTPDKELADAALKIYVRHESDSDEPDEKTVAVIVRLVNAKGFVVYPNRKGISGWKYVGTIRKLPLRVAADLMNAKK